VGRLPQTKPDGSRNRAGKAGALVATATVLFTPCWPCELG
jgi:hypothetical protein